MLPHLVNRLGLRRLAALGTFALGLAALHVAGATDAEAAPASPPGRLDLTSCRVHGATGEVRCGKLSVPEDPSHPDAKQVRLNVAVVPALSGTPRPDPVFILAGGPGQSAVSLLGNVLPMFSKVHRTRDLVFVDQRGTGKSNPLECKGSGDGGLAGNFSEDADRPGIERCLAEYRDGGDDPRLFLTTEAMDDLDAVRASLGYQQINLWGASYGTRAALSYLRQHGDHVRTAVIDGVAPNTESLLLTAAPDAQRAFELIFDACAKDASCQRTYPRLKQDFEDLLARLATEPQHLTLPHPLTGEPVSFTLTRTGFIRHLHGLLYVPEIASLLPLIIHRGAQGDFGPFVAQADVMSGGMEGGLAMGMFFSVICAEDAPAATPAAIAKDSPDSLYLGGTFARGLLDVCAYWPTGTLAPGYHDVVHSEVPTLLLSGELDPVTPPHRAEEALAGLSHGVHVIVPGVGHGTTGRGCVPDVIASFIEAGTGDHLDSSCVKTLARPPFFLGFAGPPP